MAWVVAAKPAGGHCSAVLASIRIRVASVHESSSCQKKWDSKWKSVKLLIRPSANHVLNGRFFEYSSSFPRIACKIWFASDENWFSKGVSSWSWPLTEAATDGRPFCRRCMATWMQTPSARQYVKRQNRAAGKRALLQWRSVEMQADDYRESQEWRRQKMESAQKPQAPPSSGHSRRFENEWRAFEKKFRGRYDYYTKQQSYTRSEKAADSENPTSGATEEDRGHGESESARYRRHFWSNTWRGFGVGSDCDYGANSRWGTPHQARTSQSLNIGSPSDRLVLGLSPAGPLSLEELKLAFRQCALTWHPDRHDGDQKLLAEAKFKRVGDAYRTLRELL